MSVSILALNSAMLLALLRLSPMFRAWSRDRWEPIRGAHSDGGERRFTRRHTLKLKSKKRTLALPSTFVLTFKRISP